MGAARAELRGLGEHRDPVDRRNFDRTVGIHQRGVFVPAIRNSLPAKIDQIERDCRGVAGVFVGIPAHSISERAAIHSRAGSRVDWNRSRNRDAAMGNSGDAHVALHSGCVAGRIALDPFEQPILPRLGNCGWPCDTDSLWNHGVFANMARLV